MRERGERERERERETDRQRETERDRERQRQRDRERQTERERDSQPARQTDRDRKRRRVHVTLARNQCTGCIRLNPTQLPLASYAGQAFANACMCGPSSRVSPCPRSRQIDTSAPFANKWRLHPGDLLRSTKPPARGQKAK